MPSIHPDYEYDIFISYRHNDNLPEQAGMDGWVTKFVEALRNELKTTLKNEVSIYFDENPHDGLLDTHQVDASLAKKLKCLVFMPIISQTYCDIKSYAWEQELLPFVKIANEDELGMNITLSNGNVTSRVLPVKIHDLENEDQYALEAILNGPLRSIDFIYQEPGVNRPLSPNDNEEKNINKTLYKNQINKVANALRDIGRSIIKQSEGEIHVPLIEAESSNFKASKKGIYLGLATLLIAIFSYLGYNKFYGALPTKAEDVTIAVLAFDDQSPNGDQEWLGDGMADEILNVLAKVEGLKVTGKTSSFSFKGKRLTTKEIGRTLNVSTVLEGSVSKIGDKLRITAQLIDVATDTHIWSKKYDRDAADIFAIVDEVAQSIAGSLISELSNEEVETIKMSYQPIPEAYEYLTKANQIHDEYMFTGYDSSNFFRSKELYLKALAIDPKYMDAMASLADLYDTRGNIPALNEESDRIRDSIVHVAYTIDPNSTYTLYMKGQIHGNIDSAFYFLKKAYDTDPHNLGISFLGISLVMQKYYNIGLYDESIKLCRQVLNTDPLNRYVHSVIIRSLYSSGQFEEARKESIKYLNFHDFNNEVLYRLFMINLLIERDTANAEIIHQKMDTSRGFNFRKAVLLAVEGKKEEALALNSGVEVTSLLGMKNEALAGMEARINSRNTPFISNLSYLNLKHEPLIENIRNEPQFQLWLKEAKVVYEERVAKYGHLFDE